MAQSFHIKFKILEVTRLMDKPLLDPIVRQNYINILDCFNKKQKIIDDRIEEIQEKMKQKEDDELQ